MDQNFNNNQNEFLWSLLANPANDPSLHVYNLQRLVNDFPQSGILQALLAHSSDEKNLKRASVYFNPKALYKLINTPSAFIGVASEKIVVQNKLRSNGYAVTEITDPYTEYPDNSGVENRFYEQTVEEDQFKDTLPADSSFLTEGTDEPHAPFVESWHTDPHESFHETPYAASPVTEAAEHAEEATEPEAIYNDQGTLPKVVADTSEGELTDHIEHTHLSGESTAYTAVESTHNAFVNEEHSLAPDTFKTELEQPIEDSAETTLPAEAQLTSAHGQEQVSEEETQFNEVAAARGDVEVPDYTGADTVNEMPEAPSLVESSHASTDAGDDAKITAVEPHNANVQAPDEHIEEAAGTEHDIAEDTYDEISGIDGFVPDQHTMQAAEVHAPATEPAAENISREEERLITGGIVSSDYLAFDQAFGSNKADVQPEEAQMEPVQEEKAADAGGDTAPATETEQQDVSKYHDEKMPYTFMWWLDKTRKDHEGTYQPYIKTAAAAPETEAKKPQDELQQQYYENIFHITSFEELDKATAPKAPFARTDLKPKEQVIIDRFIEEEPQIRPQSSDKLDNENKAKKSSEDRDELVTETLAAIYTDQMLYHKAIASYKKLMLKFPEKTRYFADKIEQLEKKTN